MKLYGISGLGADKRVFNFLTLNCEFVALDWINPERNERIEEYSLRLSKMINTTEEFGILGVSFGGLVATEISKIMNPKLTILISSAETKNDLRPIYRLIGKTCLMKLVPAKLFDPPRKLTHFLFGTSNKTILNNILKNTDLNFVKWAINELFNWRNEERLSQILKINGTNDKLIPPIGNKNVILIQGGGHFMIVDRATEISEIINNRMNTGTTKSYIQ